MSKSKDNRTKLLVKNVIASFFIKGWAASVALIMVPLTLECLGQYQNGVWLTISSLLVWVDHMDIGLGNGLRNKLAAHIAHQEMQEARQVVSSTMAMLVCIVFPLLLLLLLLIWYTDVYHFLNVKPDIIPELRIALICAVTLVCMTFVLKFIGNVYMGLQLPAVNNMLLALGQTLALLLTAALYWCGHASFLFIVIANTVAPLAVYVLAYPYTFWLRFPYLRPSLKFVNLHSALELGNLGIKFFWLQVAGLIQFMTANILISRFFTPEMVTPYQIAYRYISLVMVGFTVICMPFWNATTDAYERGDMDWIRHASQKMNWMIMGIAVLLVLMVAVSPWVYQLWIQRWIGDTCNVPLGMTAMMALYIFLLIISMRYSYFLNGVGALRLQLYMTVSAIVFIPLAWAVSSYTHDILWFMAVMCFCNIPGLVVNVIQFNKILNGQATGIWRY
ncbi:MAG: hypothetical protein IJ527_06315 [Prevotella sp.]|nr:hypothetical protein [Prevotella sp.]